jgi:hypothetical protein
VCEDEEVSGEKKDQIGEADVCACSSASSEALVATGCSQTRATRLENDTENTPADTCPPVRSLAKVVCRRSMGIKVPAQCEGPGKHMGDSLCASVQQGQGRFPEERVCSQIQKSRRKKKGIKTIKKNKNKKRVRRGGNGDCGIGPSPGSQQA